jgi:hypothetical protein
MNQAKQNEKARTVRQYAREESVTLQTVYRRIWSGRIRARQFRGRWLILREQQDKRILTDEGRHL